MGDCLCVLMFIPQQGYQRHPAPALYHSYRAETSVAELLNRAHADDEEDLSHSVGRRQK
jgi:hypothetical protein